VFVDGSRGLGERRALALLLLAFYATIFFLLALGQAGQWQRCFGALSVAYVMAFFALASEWFWGRWVASGIGLSGVATGVLGLLTSGWNPGLAVWAGLHAAIYVPLLGAPMACKCDDASRWRERYHVDSSAGERIRRAVQRAAMALPTLILYALAPGPGQAPAWLILGSVVLGLSGLLRLRFWGVLILVTGASVTVGALVLGVGFPASQSAGATTALVALSPSAILNMHGVVGAVGALCLLGAAAPFVRPAIESLRR